MIVKVYENNFLFSKTKKALFSKLLTNDPLFKTQNTFQKIKN
jgi:hypothetical protein